MTKATKIDVPVAQARMRDLQQRKRLTVPQSQERKTLKTPKRKAKRGGNRARMGRGLRRLQEGFCMLKVPCKAVIRKNVKGKYGEAVSVFITQLSGGAGMNMAKDVNIVLDDDRQLLVLWVQNRKCMFQEPPRWEGLARLSRVMNNLVGKTTGHHTSAGASFACGARKHFGQNSEGGTVTTYKPNARGKRLSPAALKAEQVPTIESIKRASEVIKNILGGTFWKNFKTPQEFAQKAAAKEDEGFLVRGDGWANFVANRGISTRTHTDKDANFSMLVSAVQASVEHTATFHFEGLEPLQFSQFPGSIIFYAAPQIAHYQTAHPDFWNAGSYVQKGFFAHAKNTMCARGKRQGLKQ